MDYKELVESLKSMLPPKVLYGDLIGAEGVYAHSGPLVYEDPEPYFIEQAANAITDLLARAEAAQETLQRAMVEYKDRAEKAERERDKAVKTIETIIGSQKYCALCKNTDCKNSITTDATCKPIWSGLEG